MIMSGFRENPSRRGETQPGAIRCQSFHPWRWVPVADKSLVGLKSENHSSPFRAVIASLVAALMIVLLLCRTEAPAAGIETEIHKSLEASLALIDRAKKKLEAGKQARDDIAAIKSLAQSIASSHAAIEEAFKTKEEQIHSRGARSLDRHHAMTGSYRQTIDKYTALVESLNPRSAASAQLSVVKKLKSLLERTLHKSRRPILGSLPYRDLNYPAKRPDSSPSIKPAYQGGNQADGPDDLKSTAEAPIDRDIAALAASLNWNPVALYEYVKNNIETEWYWGSMKGAEETLRQKSGNDCDQASLLTALLRASGFPTRYVRGTIEFFPGIDKVKNLTGINDEAKIAEHFRKAGIPYKTVISGGRISNFQIEHIWVESKIPYANYRGAVIDEHGKTWLALDTSIKVNDYQYGSPAELPADFPFSDIRGEYLTSSGPATPLEFLRQKIQAQLGAGGSASSYGDLLVTKTLPAETMNILPASLQFVQKTVTHEHTELPEALKHKIRFTASKNNQPLFSATLDVQSLSNRKVALGYEPETVEDQDLINLWGGLGSTPSYLVRLRPVLKVDGERIVVGADGLPAGTDYDLTMEVVSPNGTEKISGVQVTGNLSVLGITAQKAIIPPAMPEEDKNGEELLYERAMDYIDRWNKGEEELASLMRLVIVRPAPAIVTVGGVTEVAWLLDMPHGYEWRGLFLDAGLRALGCQPANSGAEDRQKLFMQLSSLEGSVLEGRVFEDAFKVESISTAKLMQAAHEQSLPLLSLNKSNLAQYLPNLPFDEYIKKDITDAVNQNQAVTIPDSEIVYQDWQGIGYLKENPATGEAGYMLSGMIAGGMTAWSADRWPGDYAQRLSDPDWEPPSRDPSSGMYIQKVSWTDLQRGKAGEKLENPLQVIVTNKAKKRVAGVPVSFKIKAGGGKFGSGSTAMTAVTDSSGIASAELVLGEKTSANPAFVTEQGAEFAQQVGENLVTATLPSGTGAVSPFTAYGHPGDPHHMKKTHGDGKIGNILSWMGFFGVVVEDLYDNPIANIPVSFTALPSIGGVECNDCRQAMVFKSGDSCLDADPDPTFGQCASEAVSVTQTSGTWGAHAHAIMGGIPEAFYPIEARFGDLSATFYPQASWVARELTLHAVFSYPADQYGNNVTAGRTGSEYPIEAKIYFILADQENHKYSRITKFDSASVEFAGRPAAPSGDDDGIFRGTHTLKPGWWHISVIANASMTLHGTEERRWADSEMDLCGVDLKIAPPPVLPVNSQGYVTEDRVLKYTLEPSDYKAATSVVLLYRDGGLIAEIPGELEGTGSITIPQGFRIEPGSRYEAMVELNHGSSVEIKSDKVPIFYLVEGADGASNLSRTFHLSQYDPATGPPESEYTDSYQVHEFNVPLPSAVSVKLYDSQSNEKATLVPETLMPAGDHSFVVDYGTIANAMGDTFDSFYLLLNMKYQDGSSLEQKSAYQGKLNTRTDGRMLGQVMVHDVLIQDGSLNLSRQDMAVTGRGPQFAFTRSYNNQAGPAGEFNPLGEGWRHSHDLKLRGISQRSNTTKPVPDWVEDFKGKFFKRSDIPEEQSSGWTRVQANGTVFKKYGGAWFPDRGNHGALDETADAFIFTSKDGTRYHYGKPTIKPEPVQKIEDRNGNAMTYAYDSEHRVQSVTDAVGRVFTFTYAKPEGLYDDRLTKVSGPDGLELTFAYNGKGCLESAQRGARIETYEYEIDRNFLLTDYNLVKATDANGNSFTYEYHKQGELDPNLGNFVKALREQDVIKKVTYPDNNSAFFSYDVNTANKRTVTGLNGHDTVYSLNYHGNPLKIEAPEGKTTSMTWSIDEGKPDNVMTSKTDARGNTTSYQHDAKGNITRETDPYNHSITTVWNQKFSLPESRIDRNFVTTEWGYDDFGNLLWQKDGDGKTTSYTWYATGEKKTMVDPRGNATGYEYDQYGSPSLVTEPENSITAFAYDIRGRKRSVTDPNGNRTDYTYDALDYPRKVISPAITAYELPEGSGNIKDTLYDAMGNLLSETNRNGLQLLYTYTARNQVKTVERNTGGQKSYTYDANGNLLTETDWKGQTITHAYNALDQRISTTNRLGFTKYMAYDLDGNLVKTVDFQGNETGYQFDALNRQTDAWYPVLPGQDPGHVKNTYFQESDPKTNLHTTTDQEGNTTTYYYNRRYLRIKQIDALGGLFQSDYDDSGNLYLETDQEGNTTLHEYDGKNRRVLTTRMGGVKTRYRYDPAGNRTELTDPRENTTRTDYDEWNRPYRVTDPDGYKTTTEYDGEGNKVKVTDANGGVRVWVRDAQGRVIYAIDAEGHTTTNGYDLNDNLVSVKEPNGTLSETDYDREDKPALTTETASNGVKRQKGILSRDKNGNPLRVRDYLGNITVTEYNALNLPQSVYDPAPFNTLHTDTSYFKTGKVRSVTNRRGHTTGHEYDALNREVKVTDPLGQAIETAYDRVGNVKTVRDKRGIVKENFYDSLYRLERVVKDGLRLITNEYDANGNLTAAIDANNNRIEHTYNKRNLHETTKYPATGAFPGGTIESRTYDGVGNLLTLTDEENKVTTYAYDRENRQTSSEFAGEKTVKTYDAVGNLASVTKPLGNRKTMTYDGFKRLTSVVEDPNGLNLATRYWYDVNNNLVNRYDPRNNRTQFDYDSLNRKTREIRWKNSGNLVTRYTYDEEGNLAETTDPKGQLFTYAYDKLNRQTAADYPPSSTPFNTINRSETGYDANNNVTSVTEYKTGVDNSSIVDSTVNQYDHFDRLTTSTQRGMAISYTYDDNGNRTSVTTPAGSTAYTFDSRNRIETAVADGLATTYTYYADGKKNTIAYPNGTSIGYTYHPTNRVKTVANLSGEAVLSHYSYFYDKNGNRLWQTEVQNGATEVTSYAYDRVDRLISFTVTGAGEPRTTDYTYEGYNRKTEKFTRNGTVEKNQAYSYDETDWLKRIEDGAKTVAYEYDANGNTTRKVDNSLPNQDVTFSYDSKNQLIETKKGIPGNEEILGRYDYNAQGLRIRHRLSDRGDVDYFYDGRSVIEEHNAQDDTLLAHYRYADRLVSLDTGAGKQYYHYDALGSTVNLTDDSGSTPVSYQLDPWGHIRNKFGATVNRHIFTGKEHDENTGLIYFGARYYDPDTARFITQDPYLGQQDTPPSLHRYLYAYSNPTVYIDLYGYMSNREMWGIDDRSVNKALAEDSSMSTVLSLTAKSTAYALWNGVTGGFVERHDKRIEALERGELTDNQFWSSTGIDTGVSIGSQFAGGKVGGAVSSRVMAGSGSALTSAVAAGGVTSGFSSLTEQSAQVGTYYATDGRQGQSEIDFGQVVQSTASGMVTAGFLHGAEKTVGRISEHVQASKLKGKSSSGTAMTAEDSSGALPMSGQPKEVYGVCFVAGTPIQTIDGLKPIERIEVGDIVLSRNEKTGDLALRRATRIKITHDIPVLEIELTDENGKIEKFGTTAEHPFWVKDRQWMPAKELLPGDEIYSSNGGWLKVSGATWLSRTQTVYNFSVDEFHNYFIGEVGAWVHNDDACIVQPKGAVREASATAASENRKFIDKQGRLRNSDGTFASGGESNLARRGRKAHESYKNALPPDYDHQVTLPSGKRPDAVSWEHRDVRELKPDNSKAISKGERQVEKYRRELEELTDEPWSSHVDTYKR